MAAKKASATNSEIIITEVNRQSITIPIIGQTPLICNAMSQKVQQELLMPKGRKTAADKASTMKHNVIEEYRDSIYEQAEGAETMICVPSTMFKGAMRNAAVDLPGSSKAQIGRLTYVEGVYVSIYGIPQMLMSVTRSADINKTPDVRTRAIIPEWCCEITVTYVVPLLRDAAIVNLLVAAGMMQGIGDWRPEKGKGDFGQFTLLQEGDKEGKERFDLIRSSGGYQAQAEAMKTPSFYDEETRKLYEWWTVEKKRRGFKEVA